MNFNFLKLYTGYSYTTIFDYALDALLLVMILHATFPPAEAVIGSQSFGIFLAIIWLLLAFMIRPRSKVIIGNHILIWGGILGYTILAPRLFDNSTIGNRYFSYLIPMMFYIAHKYNKIYSGNSRNLKILLVCIPFMVYTFINTLLALRENPWAARIIKTTDDTQQTYTMMKSGVGGYDFVYMMTFLTIIYTSIVIHSSRLEKKSLYIIFVKSLLLLLMIYFLIISNFFTALAIYTISFLILFLGSNIKLHTKILLSFMIVLVIGNLVAVNSDKLALLTGEGKTYERIQKLMDMEGVRTISQERSSENNESVILFFENPIFGNINKNYNFNGFNFEGFGQHSMILDTYALFGVFIGTMLIGCMLLPFWYYLLSTVHFRNLALVMLISSFLIMYFNNFTSSLGLVLYFVFPSTWDYINNHLNPTQSD